MSERKNPIDSILDPNNSENIILYNENDEPIEFEQFAVIPIEERIFVILQPVVRINGMGDDEAFAFEIVGENEDRTLALVEDDDLIDQVFAEYRDLYIREANKH